MKRKLKRRSLKEFINFLTEGIPWIKENKKTLYFVPLLILFSLVVCLPFIGAIIFVQLFDPLVNMFVNDFGKIAIADFFAVLLVCVFFFGLIAISKIMRKTIFRVKQKWTAFIIYSIIITLFLCGAVFIHAIIGVPNNSWQLFEGKEYVSDISCGDLNEKLIEGHKIWCNPENKKFEFSVTNGTILISLTNGTIIQENFNSFIAPQDIKHISIKLYAVYNNTAYLFNTGFYPSFYSKEEERQRQKDFLTYFFGLLFICLITIPQLVIKIRDGLEKEN